MTFGTTLLGTPRGSALDTVELVALRASTSNDVLVATGHAHRVDHVAETPSVEFQQMAFVTSVQSLV